MPLGIVARPESITRRHRQLQPQVRQAGRVGRPRRILYVCLDCKKQFFVTEGTVFNDTHLPLEKWFHAVALMVNAKKGLSAMQLQRDLITAYKDFLLSRNALLKAMGLIEQAGDQRSPEWSNSIGASYRSAVELAAESSLAATPEACCLREQKPTKNHQKAS